MLGENPDLAYSRLLCPRQLDAEHRPITRSSSRRSRPGGWPGSGLDPATRPHATHSAWGDYAEGPARRPTASPTTTAGSSAPARSATSSTSCGCSSRGPPTRASACRDMDVQHPGSNLPGITEPELGGVLRLGGALQGARVGADGRRSSRRPSATRTWDASPTIPHPFQQRPRGPGQPGRRLRAPQPATPTPPSGLGPSVDGRPRPADHAAAVRALARAARRRLLTDRDGEPARPRRQLGPRAQPRPALPGAGRLRHGVMQAGQEEYMDAAWAAGRRRARGQPPDPRRPAGRAGGGVMAHRSIVEPLLQTNRDAAVADHGAGPLAGCSAGGVTASARSAAERRRRRAARRRPMRRVVRPGARLVARAGVRRASVGAGRRCSTRVNAGAVRRAPRRRPAPPRPSAPRTTLAEELAPSDGPTWLARRARALRRVLLRCVLPARRSRRRCSCCRRSSSASWLWRAARAAGTRACARAASVHRRRAQTPDAVDDLPRSPDFVLTEPGTPIRPSPGQTRQRGGGTRSRPACATWPSRCRRRPRPAQTPPPTPLDLATVAAAAARRHRPARTIPRRVLGSITLPGRLVAADRRAVRRRRWPTPSSTCRCTSRWSTCRAELLPAEHAT